MDKLTPQRRSANMARIQSRGMKPELVVRKLVHSMGYRYRLHRKDLSGKPDLVFAARRKVIFVHGCFWHQHSAENCLDGRQPKSNVGYWRPKLTRNVERDAKHLSRLEADGWQVLVIWECETKKLGDIARRIASFL